MKTIITTLLLIGGIGATTFGQSASLTTCYDGTAADTRVIELSGIETGHSGSAHSESIKFDEEVYIKGMYMQDLNTTVAADSYCYDTKLQIILIDQTDDPTTDEVPYEYAYFYTGNSFDNSCSDITQDAQEKTFYRLNSEKDGTINFIAEDVYNDYTDGPDQIINSGTITVYGCPYARILPVKLTSFEGEALKDKNIISWSATSEVNFSHYSVEVSTNGEDWKEAGQVYKNENGDLVNKYTFTHHYPSLYAFYRLNMIDLDGSSEYSDILSLTNEDVTQSISVYPNPAQDMLNVLSSEEVQNIEVYNSKGVLMFFKKENDQQLDVSSLVEGMYMIKVETANGVQTQKFIKK